MGLLGAVFEMPVLAFLLARIGLLRAEFLSRYRRHAVVVNLVLAAGITPTGDPLSLALVGVPLILLYEISIVVVRISQQRAEDARANPEFT
jgi:sec-independent protein translocase protein TatC